MYVLSMQGCNYMALILTMIRIIYNNNKNAISG